MNYNLLPNLQYCHDTFVSIASLVYYTRIPTIIFALSAGIYIFVKRRDRMGLTLLALTVVFSLWTCFDLLQYARTDLTTPIMVTWSLFGILAGLMFYLMHSFTHQFMNEKPLPAWMMTVWIVLILPILVYTPTMTNLQGYDIRNCIAVEGPWFTNYYFLLGVPAMLLMAVSAYFGLRKKALAQTTDERSAKWLVFVGGELFIFAFITTGILASYLVDSGIIPDYGIDQYGLATMALFIGLIGYVTVRYHAFNVKLLGAQALVLALGLLVASEYLFVQSVTNRWLVTFTLVLVLFFGWMLVRSVKREVQQRERIEKLAKDLEAANVKLKELDRLKSEFLSIASHQLRAPLTAIKGYAANVVDGSYGAVPEYLAQPLGVIQESARLMVSSIEDYLNISRIEQGRMKYELAPVALGALAGKVADELRPVAAARKLALNYTAPGEEVTVSADVGKIKQVITNLVDNAIKYTEQGSVSLAVEKKDGKARITITDTGIGIAKEEIGALFEKFTRARDANKVNTTGTGLGLYVAKQLVEGHKGKIWIESDGVGKGTRFIVELPI
jgi:signal transduction histidine kinase